jgi:PAS domain-containing protein
MFIILNNALADMLLYLDATLRGEGGSMFLALILGGAFLLVVLLLYLAWRPKKRLEQQTSANPQHLADELLQKSSASTTIYKVAGNEPYSLGSTVTSMDLQSPAAHASVHSAISPNIMKQAPALVSPVVYHETPYEILLNHLPHPVWLRDENLKLIYVNLAYAAALDSTIDDTLNGQLELAKGILGADGLDLARKVKTNFRREQSKQHLIVRGNRRYYELTEAPTSAIGGQLGYALDLSNAENSAEEIERQEKAFEEIMEYMGSAIAHYNKDKHLVFYNASFANLWNLQEDWLNTKPDYAAILESLRESRQLQEHADYPSFKKAQLSLFNNLLEPKQEIAHLPDERTIKSTIIPHPLGGLIFSYEDVTDRLALERNFRTLGAVQQATLDNLFESIAVFGGDGRLKLVNPAFGRLWQLDLALIQDSNLHISEILDNLRNFFCHPHEQAKHWPDMRMRLIALFTQRERGNGRISRLDDTIVEYSVSPLPDGATLLSFIDMTATVNVENALIERNNALEKADRVKSEFIAHMSYELRTPLNAIIGFSEMLKENLLGPMSPKQQAYISYILKSSVQLKSLIDDILDLASLEAGYVTLHKTETHIETMLMNVLKLRRLIFKLSVMKR